MNNVGLGTVIAQVEEGTETDGITVVGHLLSVSDGQLVVTEKPVSSVIPKAEIERVTDDTTDNDKDAVGFVGNVNVTGTAQIGFKITTNGNSEFAGGEKDWVYDTVISASESESTNVIFGLLITDFEKFGLSRDDITAAYLD